eukprot:TRINITY_DN43414_c0_g1_i1.p1 TRINITY_DN43414_c0_g1~~TRINITY_DN43414_c0_g1_i1.p1  ORF type:complete len:963 (+),score=152.13 TRINITY_DN43414_c0_g1_i1:48-2891(+)
MAGTAAAFPKITKPVGTAVITRRVDGTVVGKTCGPAFAPGLSGAAVGSGISGGRGCNGNFTVRPTIPKEREPLYREDLNELWSHNKELQQRLDELKERFDAHFDAEVNNNNKDPPSPAGLAVEDKYVSSLLSRVEARMERYCAGLYDEQVNLLMAQLDQVGLAGPSSTQGFTESDAKGVDQVLRHHSGRLTSIERHIGMAPQTSRDLLSEVLPSTADHAAGRSPHRSSQSTRWPWASARQGGPTFLFGHTNRPIYNGVLQRRGTFMQDPSSREGRNPRGFLGSTSVDTSTDFELFRFRCEKRMDRLEGAFRVLLGRIDDSVAAVSSSDVGANVGSGSANVSVNTNGRAVGNAACGCNDRAPSFADSTMSNSGSVAAQSFASFGASPQPSCEGGTVGSMEVVQASVKLVPGNVEFEQALADANSAVSARLSGLSFKDVDAVGFSDEPVFKPQRHRSSSEPYLDTHHRSSCGSVGGSGAVVVSVPSDTTNNAPVCGSAFTSPTDGSGGTGMGCSGGGGGSSSINGQKTVTIASSGGSLRGAAIAWPSGGTGGVGGSGCVAANVGAPPPPTSWSNVGISGACCNAPAAMIGQNSVACGSAPSDSAGRTHGSGVISCDGADDTQMGTETRPHTSRTVPVPNSGFRWDLRPLPFGAPPSDPAQRTASPREAAARCRRQSHADAERLMSGHSQHGAEASTCSNIRGRRLIARSSSPNVLTAKRRLAALVAYRLDGTGPSRGMAPPPTIALVQSPQVHDTPALNGVPNAAPPNVVSFGGNPTVPASSSAVHSASRGWSMPPSTGSPVDMVPQAGGVWQAPTADPRYSWGWMIPQEELGVEQTPSSRGRAGPSPPGGQRGGVSVSPPAQVPATVPAASAVQFFADGNGGFSRPVLDPSRASATMGRRYLRKSTSPVEEQVRRRLRGRSGADAVAVATPRCPSPAWPWWLQPRQLR